MSEKKGKLSGFLKKHLKAIIVLLIIAIAVIGVVAFLNSKKKQMPDLSSQTFTTDVEKMDLQSSVSVTGKLAAIDDADVTSTASGKKVEKIYYAVGDYVEEGSTVVTFSASDDDYEKKLQELNAKYQLSDIKNAKTLQDDLTKISEKEKEIADLQEDIQEIEQYLADNENIYKNLCDARDEWLYAQQYCESDSTPYKKAKNRYDTETNAAATLADPVSIKDYEAKEETLKTNKDKLETLNTELNTLKYNYEYDQLQQEYDNTYTKANEYEQYDSTKVVAPISGYITAINVTEGNNYTQGSVVFTISNTQAFVVEATVDEFDIASIKTGLNCVVKFDATDDEEFSGEVTFVAIAPTSSSSSSAAGSGMSTSSSSSSTGYDIKIKLNDTDDRLRIGMTAKASVIIDSVSGVLAVPYDCVTTDSDGKSFVTVVDDENNETKVSVTLGMESDYYVEIQSDKITEGTKIKATASSGSGLQDGFGMMMNGGPGGGDFDGAPSGGPGGF